MAERYAADFADELTRKPWDVERLRRFAADCPPGPVLDVGCGPAGHVGASSPTSARASWASTSPSGRWRWRNA